MVVLKDADTLYLKIFNATDSAIFIPEYFTNFQSQNDTIHLEISNKKKYSINDFCLYKNVFPFEFFTSKPIKNISPDLIDHRQTQTTFYNQFRISPLVKVEINSSKLIILRYSNFPKYKTFVEAVYYKTNFPLISNRNEVNYLEEDVLRFDSINSYYVNSPILIRYE